MKKLLFITILSLCPIICMSGQGMGPGPGVMTYATGGGVSVSDNFNRANVNPIGGNWTTVTGNNAVKILSNAVAPAVGSSGSIGSAIYYNAVTFPNDQCSQATLILINGAIYAGPTVRTNSSENTFYQLSTNGVTNYQVFKTIAGTSTQIGGNIALTPTVNDVLKICAQGTSIMVYVNSVLKATIIDSAITSGSAGLAIYYSVTSDSVLDTWSGWSL